MGEGPHGRPSPVGNVSVRVMGGHVLKGVNASEGIGIGVARVAVEPDLSYANVAPKDPVAEKARFRSAVDAFVEKTKAQVELLKDVMGEKEAQIVATHVDFACDKALWASVGEGIDSGNCAEEALCQACDYFCGLLAAADSERVKERCADIVDVRTGLLASLLGKDVVDLSSLPLGSVLVVRELTPSMMSAFGEGVVAGIIAETGGRTSHSAILARALEIPAVFSVAGATSVVSSGDVVVCDGTAGEVHVAPDETTLEVFRSKARSLAEEKTALEDLRGVPTATADGRRIRLGANIGKPEDVDAVLANDAEGVGLFRSEFLFMGATEVPGEEEQFAAFKGVALRMGEKPVIIRTLDASGDKAIPCLDLADEGNPLMGMRGVRFCLENPDLFKTQLRAALRASAFGNVKIMVPLITCLDEFRRVRELVEACKSELDAEGVDYDRQVEVGAMIETPAAVMVADQLAAECDFFSIGTNDLAGYTMCVDRGDDGIGDLYSVYQPAVLRSIKRVIEEGNKAGITVGMCGEAAADPLLVPLFVSFGLAECSVSAPFVLRTRKAISRWGKAEADALAERVLALKTATEVLDALKEASVLVASR